MTPRAAIVAGAVAVFVVVGGGGCLTMNPARHVKATGEPLAVDGSGDDVRFRQGRTEIDEQDFYELAGDSRAVGTIRGKRTKTTIKEVTYDAVGCGGIGGMLVGGGGLAAGIVWTVDSGPIGLLALIPGALLLTASIVAVPVGFAQAADEEDQMFEPVLPPERAEGAAKRYNRRFKQR